ncbi:hypothetical protein [Gardnerella sp. Marseille-Q2328]|uniref:hypothetical protein n=1 Tax=Gardnerella sp. Marseille-Q2328 TaxID=2759694 RepID=UPI0020256B5B|nr:hypothetical protein [Gardnerella sp. Marseille-Q2328]
MFQTPAKTLARIATRSLTKLALEVPRTSNLSEFPLRVAFARYALSASAGRRANTGNSPANVPKKGQNNNKRRRKISGECSTKKSH